MDKKPLKIYCFVLLFLFLSGCFSSVEPQKPDGEIARLWITDKIYHDVELLSIEDSSIIYNYNKKIYRSNLKDFKSIYIPEFTIKPFKLLSLFCTGVIEAISLAGLIHDRNENVEYYLINSGLLALTIAAVVTGDPKAEFTNPFSKEDQKMLNLYARFPKGLDPNKWKELLRLHNQNDFLVNIDTQH